MGTGGSRQFRQRLQKPRVLQRLHTSDSLSNCLGENCAYFGHHTNLTGPMLHGQYRCTCECPHSNDQGEAYVVKNSTKVCVAACIAVPTNLCVMSNTYACLGTQCVYSDGYVNLTSTTRTERYRCTCQCPYGSDQGVAYASQNSSAACVDACRMAPGNPCNSGSTYACLDTDCAFSSSYLRRCSCECPFGDSQGSFYTFINSTEGCVNACIAVSSNNCGPSNTYACLGDRCVYSPLHDNTSIGKPPRFRCSCHCPYDTSQGIAWTKSNSSEACVSACIASPTYGCGTGNTYACLGSDCTYSNS